MAFEERGFAPPALPRLTITLTRRHILGALGGVVAAGMLPTVPVFAATGAGIWSGFIPVLAIISSIRASWSR